MSSCHLCHKSASEPCFHIACPRRLSHHAEAMTKTTDTPLLTAELTTALIKRLNSGVWKCNPDVLFAALYAIEEGRAVVRPATDEGVDELLRDAWNWIESLSKGSVKAECATRDIHRRLRTELEARLDPR